MEIMMRNAAIAAALAMAIAPAAAEQSGTAQKSGTAPQAGATQSGTMQSNSSSTQAARPSAAAQAKLRDSLQQAGFKDIKIMDAAYLVHARTTDGNFAVMYIDPPSAAAGTTGSSSGAAGSNGSPQSMAMTQTKVRESLEKAGFKDVKIVDAAYLVNANTSDGSKAIMYVNPSSAMSGDKASTGTSAGTGTSTGTRDHSK
jgi:hypothetical protein